MRQEKQIDLPDWLDPEVWFDYVDHRRIKKAPMTKRAKELAIMNLDKLRQSEDPRVIVDRSLDKGWVGLFPPPKHKIESSLSVVAKEKGLEPKVGESQEQFNDRIRRTR